MELKSGAPLWPIKNLLDRRDIAHGSTAASTALLQYELDADLRDLILQIGEARAVLAYRLCFKAIGQFETLAKHPRLNCEFTRRPSIYLASNAKALPGLKREFETRQRHGFEVSWLEKPEIESHFSFSRSNV